MSFFFPPSSQDCYYLYFEAVAHSFVLYQLSDIFYGMIFNTLARIFCFFEYDPLGYLFCHTVGKRRQKSFSLPVPLQSIPFGLTKCKYLIILLAFSYRWIFPTICYKLFERRSSSCFRFFMVSEVSSRRCCKYEVSKMFLMHHRFRCHILPRLACGPSM